MSTISIDTTGMTKLSYERGGSYFIDSKKISEKMIGKMKYFQLKIEGWSNRRTFFVDVKNGFTLFQASAEGTDCHRCGICQDRMRMIGHKTDHVFVEIERYDSLYQKTMGVPSDLTAEGIAAYLGLPVVSA